MTHLEKIVEYAHSTAHHARQAENTDARHATFHELVLAHGRVFEPAPLPDTVYPALPAHRFKAAMILSDHHGLVYVEGLALLPDTQTVIEHAWCSTWLGHVVDPGLGGDTAAAYLDIPFTLEFRRRAVARAKGTWSVLLGDPGGHVRAALDAFPLPGVAQRIVSMYYVAGGKPPDAPFRPAPRFTLKPARVLQELTVAANFAEVLLAKQGHAGAVGINYLRKIELPLPFACYGALLAGADHVTVGAGNPAELPLMLDRLVCHQPVSLQVRVQGSTSADGDDAICFDPGALGDTRALAPLRRPRFAAIVSSVELARALAGDRATRPDGFIVEGHPAGGHNAPPRGARRLDESGQPLYGEADVVAPDALAGLGLPYWMAGSYGTPAAAVHVDQRGAVGVALLERELVHTQQCR